MLVDRKELYQSSSTVRYKEDIEEIKSILNIMQEEVKKFPNAVGLSAPQVGVFKRIVLCIFQGSWHVMLNPVVTNKQGSAVKRETCLSVLGAYEVKRAVIGKVHYIAKGGYSKVIVLKGQDLRRVLHEIDHLRGLCIDDVGRPASSAQ